MTVALTAAMALLLAIGLAALARAQRMARHPRALRGAGAALVAAALLCACLGQGWTGLMLWFGLVPVGAGAAMLAVR